MCAKGAWQSCGWHVLHTSTSSDAFAGTVSLPKGRVTVVVSVLHVHYSYSQIIIGEGESVLYTHCVSKWTATSFYL